MKNLTQRPHREGKAAKSIATAHDAPPAPSIPTLIRDWKRYLAHQQAYSGVHVSKSAEAATAWADFAKRRGWNPTAGMRWAQELLKSGARKTAQNKMSQAREFCRYLVLVGKLQDNPLCDVKISNGRRDRRRQWAPFSLAQVSALIDAAEAREASADRRRTKNGPLASTLYAFMAHTGLRMGESRAQLWADIDLAKASMIVTADKAKRRDILPLTAEAIASLRAWRKWSQGERVFPKVPSAHTLRADMDAAKIPHGREAGERGEWHRFRKAAIAERAAAGADVRNLHHFARHENIQTTLSVYDRAQVEQLRGVANLMPTLNGFLKRAAKIEEAQAATVQRVTDIRPRKAEVPLDCAARNGRNMGVQTESPDDLHELHSQHHESGERAVIAASEQPTPSGVVRRPRPAVRASVNGAVGN